MKKKEKISDSESNEDSGSSKNNTNKEISSDEDDHLLEKKEGEQQQVTSPNKQLLDKDTPVLKKKVNFVSIVGEEVPWYAMRDCLLLLLQSRIELKQMIKEKLKEERTRLGTLGISEIQNLLLSQENEETDWISRIQELKRNLVNEVRRNHVLEKELAKLDKRIALLIKNRGNIQEVIAASHGRKTTTVSDGSSEISARKLEHYQNLFYLLQTEPKYLAQLVYLMKNEQMEGFLDTVILTLFGDGFSPREEYLTLELFSLSIRKEMSSLTSVNDFLKADSVVPKMVITYNRRKQGTEFLKTILGPIIQKFIGRKDLNLELKPMMIYQAMISEQEIATGEKTTFDRSLSEEKIAELPEVKKIIKERSKELKKVCLTFLEAITKNVKTIPYGMRWICKSIKHLSDEQFKNPNDIDVFRVIGYFVYYRFLNLAIVTPESFEITNEELTATARRNLVAISKVLQTLFNFGTFEKTDKWFSPLNKWVKSKNQIIIDFFGELMDVPEPTEFLQVDKYMELTQKTKPVIIISLHEISQTHQYLKQHAAKLAKDKEDPLNVILNDLEAPPVVNKQDDREIQLTLTNRFKSNTMEEEVSASESLFAETKELIINTFRSIPVQPETADEEEQTLVGILNAGKQFAKDQNKKKLQKQIEQIFENMKSLETEGLITKTDKYAGFLRNIALEVANRAEIREQQSKEIKRLENTLNNLKKHQKYLNEQIADYNDYLQACRLKHYQPKKPKKSKKNSENPNQIGPFKFSYSALQKKGVIIDSEVPAISRKKCYFYISSDAVGVFEINAKIAGVTVESITLELDDLLEKNYNNITNYELEQVTLDVNMMIHLLNKFFLK